MEELNPNVEAYFKQGMDYYNRGDFLRATEQWKLAVQTAPDFVDGHKYLALAYEKLGWKHKARKQWERYLSIETDARARRQVEERLKQL